MVVVGGGGSGMSATIRGRMNGMNVILVEKMPYIGGAAAISGGQVVAQGSKLQKAFGSTGRLSESMIRTWPTATTSTTRSRSRSTPTMSAPRSAA
ncbi:MAG: FAD-binding protein [Sutterella wadsworthensis]